MALNERNGPNRTPRNLSQRRTKAVALLNGASPSRRPLVISVAALLLSTPSLAAVPAATAGSTHSDPEAVAEADLHSLTPATGRVPGSAAHVSAAAYIQMRLEGIGLEPFFAHDGPERVFLQPLDAGADTAPSIAAVRYLPEMGEPVEVAADQVQPHWASAVGEVRSEGVFAGYSIVTGPEGYMSFGARNDLEGKVAVALRLEPMDDAGESLWTDGNGWSFRSSSLAKAAALARRNASAVILVTPRDAVDPESAEPARNPDQQVQFTVPVVTIDADAADRFLTLADPESRTTLDLQTLANDAPVFADLAGTFEVRVEPPAEAAPVHNVAAMLPGKGELAREVVLISASFDTPDATPGANAHTSGAVTAMLAANLLTEAFKDELPAVESARSIVVFASGIGARSQAGMNAFLDALEDDGSHELAAALLLDSLGRSEREQLAIVGANSGEGLDDWLAPFIERSFFEIDSQPLRRSSRSMMPTFERGTPTLLFTTGFNRADRGDADTPETLDIDSMIIASELIAEIALELALRTDKFEAEEDAANVQRPGTERRVRLGVQPRFDSDDDGVVIQRVFDDTAASEAGLMAGDRIVQWNETEIAGIDQFALQLATTKPGDVVTITVVRDGEQQRVEVRFEDD